jgi:hypothetical protein
MAKQPRFWSSVSWPCREGGIFRGSLALVVTAGTLLMGYSARAQCAAPPSAILWSHPADGETDVPTNVVLWILPVGAGELEVSLNGTTLSASEDLFSYALGDLAPNTSYRVAFDFGGRSLPVHVEQSFSTGSGPAEPQPAAAPGAIAASRRGQSERPLSDFCNAVLQAQDCFDTGQDTHFVFAPEGTATAWLVREDRQYGHGPLLWPAECGAPDFFSHQDSQPCVILSGIDRAGVLHEGQRACAPAPALAAPAIPARGQAMAPPMDIAPVAPAASSMTPSTHVGGCSLLASRNSSARPLLSALLALSLAVSQRRRATPAR